jgi:hypothetical protein
MFDLQPLYTKTDQCTPDTSPLPGWCDSDRSQQGSTCVAFIQAAPGEDGMSDNVPVDHRDK